MRVIVGIKLFYIDNQSQLSKHQIKAENRRVMQLFDVLANCDWLSV